MARVGLTALVAGCLLVAAPGWAGAEPATARGPITTLWTARYASNANTLTAATIAAPDGSRVYVTGENGAGMVTLAYDAATGKRVWRANYASGGDAIAIATSPNGSSVFVTGYVGYWGTAYATVAYDAATGRQLWEQDFGTNQPEGVGVSPDSTVVFVTGGSGTVAYQASTGTELWTESVNGDAVVTSPDGSAVFVGGPSLVRLNAGSGQIEWRDYVASTDLAVSPDGSSVYANAVTGSIGHWSWVVSGLRASDGATLWQDTLGPYGNPVYDLWAAVSPDGSTLYSAGYALEAFDAATGVAGWARTDVPTSAVALSLDGRFIATSGQYFGPRDYVVATQVVRASDGSSVGSPRWLKGIDNNGHVGVAVASDSRAFYVTATELSRKTGDDYLTTAYGRA